MFNLRSFTNFAKFKLKNIFSSKMSTESTKACCAAGKPKSDDYKCCGTELNLSQDLKAYHVGQGNQSGVVLVYDIFGFDISQTRRFADYLSKESFNVIMPDFFRGKPWSLEGFPPKDYSELIKWMETMGSYDIVKEDLKLALDYLYKSGIKGKPGILGFCWGGKMSSFACQGLDFSCGISVHGAGIIPEITRDVKVPMMFLPASDDPSLSDVEETFKDKDFGKDCVFYRFDNMNHGFAAARGDWKDEINKKEILKVISMSKDFLSKHIR